MWLKYIRSKDSDTLLSLFWWITFFHQWTDISEDHFRLNESMHYAIKRPKILQLIDTTKKDTESQCSSPSISYFTSSLIFASFNKPGSIRIYQCWQILLYVTSVTCTHSRSCDYVLSHLAIALYIPVNTQNVNWHIEILCPSMLRQWVGRFFLNI